MNGFHSNLLCMYVYIHIHMICIEYIGVRTQSRQPCHNGKRGAACCNAVSLLVSSVRNGKIPRLGLSEKSWGRIFLWWKLEGRFWKRRDVGKGMERGNSRMLWFFSMRISYLWFAKCFSQTNTFKKKKHYWQILKVEFLEYHAMAYFLLAGLTCSWAIPALRKWSFHFLDGWNMKKHALTKVELKPFPFIDIKITHSTTQVH